MQFIKNPQPAMSMQQIMRWGHDFLRNGEGECLTLSVWGKVMCQKETPKKVCPFPSCIHVFIFPHILGSEGHFDHPSFTFLVGRSFSLCMLSPSSGFHPKHCGRLWSFLIPSCACALCIHPVAEPYFVLRCLSVAWILSVVVHWSPLSQREWKLVLLC